LYATMIAYFNTGDV